MENTKEFKNLLDLLGSINKENVVLGLQVAQNYKQEFLAYFGCEVREMADLVDILTENNGWNVAMPLLEISHLNCDNRNLHEFPRAICALKEIKYLNLENNQLQNIPKEIENLTKLSDLDLTYNQLGSIPKEILSLPNLSQLYLGNNQIQSIPNEICKLINLKSINISNNKIPTNEIENIRKILPNCQIVA